jgi:hypothetical protein
MLVRLAPDPLKVVAVQVVNAPVLAEVFPIGPGVEKRAVSPVPVGVPVKVATPVTARELAVVSPLELTVVNEPAF